MDPEAAEVSNRGKPLDQGGEEVVVKRKWISPTENNLPDRWVSRDPLQGQLPPGRQVRGLVVRKMPAKAEAAMDGTGSGCYH